MADRAIGELSQVTTMTDGDLFVLEQNSVARSLSWKTFIDSSLERLQGMGGIDSVVYREPEDNELNGELTITYVNGGSDSFYIRNGRGIRNISAPTTSGLTDTYTINYNDGSQSTFQVKNGAKGDTGAAAYIHIKYASVRPTKDSDIGNLPDAWMGVATNSSTVPPTSYALYNWYNIKGTAGDTGASATVDGYVTEYVYSLSGNEIPASGWSTTIPAPVDGSFLWTRTTINFNSGEPVVSYSVSKIGSNGSGSGTVRNVTINNPTLDLMPTAKVEITDTGSVNIGHQMTPVGGAKTTQAVYPIKIDQFGHISSSGAAATAESLGGIKNPATKSNGQYLKYNGTEWVADTVTGGVSAVNGKTGAVTLNSADIGAINNPDAKSDGQYLKFNGTDWVASDISASGLTSTELWTNSSTGSNFAQGSVAVNADGYKMLYVVFIQVKSGSAYAGFVYPVNATYALVCISQGWGNIVTYKREITSASPTRVYFSGGKKVGNNDTSATDDDSVMIPYKIYGLK